MQIHELTALARNSKASDIHISEGLPLMFRIDGHLAEAPVQLSAAETRSLILSLMDEAHREAITSERIDADFALVAPDGTRSRVNVFYQQGRAAATLRLLNDSIPTLEELAMPPVLTKLADEPRGLILVTGPTGSGKSTLINLIPRFYDCTSGSVELFGHAVQQYGFAQLRQMIGIVPQRAVLFTGTIRDNMQWACPDATDEQIWQALEIAQAADFVRGKPKGLDEPVETAGRNFSGGQRQRLTIARALVPHPQVLILDDSSSALDFATDAALRKALKEQTHGMTVFIVSQRAAAVQRADRILVLDDGNLVGSGTHANLLKTCDVYREICLSQLSREEVEKTL